VNDEIHYRVPLRVRGAYPGFHHSRSNGSGFEFREHTELWRSPDPRRIDLRASLNNPFGNLIVRVFNQRAAISVRIIADLSASMAAPQPDGKLGTLRRLTKALAYSAARTGDRIGFIGCDERVREDFLEPPRRHSQIKRIVNLLEDFRPDGRSASGLADVGQYLDKESELVFLVSDFIFDTTLLEKTLENLSRSFVVPTMLTHPSETNGPAGFGFARSVDSETGRGRTIFLRPAFRRRVRERYRSHRNQFESICARYNLRPLYLSPDFLLDDVNRYFYPAGSVS